MDTTRLKERKSSALFEYFLYAAIIAETGLAAFVYKVIFRDPGLARFQIHFGVFYCAFLAWPVYQLNSVHRRRKGEVREPEREPPEPVRTGAAPGLTTAQVAIVVVVFMTALATFSWALKLLR
jgi:hypothetical protein